MQGTGWYQEYLTGLAEDNLVEVRGLVGPEAQRRARTSVVKKLGTVKRDHQALNVLTVTSLNHILKGKYDEKVFPPPSRAGFPSFVLEAIQGFEHILKHAHCESREETHLRAFITDYTKHRQDLNNKFLGGGYMDDNWREQASSVSDDWTAKLDKKVHSLSALVKAMSKRRTEEKLAGDFVDIKEKYTTLVDVITRELMHALYRADLMKNRRSSNEVLRELDHELKRTSTYIQLKQLLKDIRQKMFKLFKDNKSMLFTTSLKEAKKLYKLEGDDQDRFINDVEPTTPTNLSIQEKTVIDVLGRLLTPIVGRTDVPKPQQASSPLSAVVSARMPTPRSAPPADKDGEARRPTSSMGMEQEGLMSVGGAACQGILQQRLADLCNQQMNTQDPHEQQALAAAFNDELQEAEKQQSNLVKTPVRQQMAQPVINDLRNKEQPTNIYLDDALFKSLVRKSDQSGCKDCQVEYDYWPRDKANNCLGQIHCFKMCPGHFTSILKFHGKHLELKRDSSRTFYIYDFRGCQCEGCAKIMSRANLQLKDKKLPRFADWKKFQSVFKSTIKRLRRTLSNDDARVAAKSIEEIAEKEQTHPTNGNKKSSGDHLSPVQEEGNDKVAEGGQHGELPPTNRGMTGGNTSLLAHWRTADGSVLGQESANGTYLPNGQREQTARRTAPSAPPPPPNDNRRYQKNAGGGGGDPDPSDDEDSDASNGRGGGSDRGRRRRRNGGPPDSSPDHSPDSAESDDEDKGKQSASTRSTRHVTTSSVAETPPQRTVLVQQTTLAAAGCSVFTGNPFQYIPWRSIVDSVFKNSQDENAIRHSQLLRFIGGNALKRVDHVRINANDSALTVLDLLHEHFYKPDSLKNMKVTNLLQMRIPGKTLADVDQIVECEKYIQCMKEVLECDTLYGVEVEWEHIITQIMTKNEVRENHYKKWQLRCQKTAEEKHAGYYKDLPDYRRHQNLNFPRDRFVDFMNLLQDILKVDRYKANYAYESGINNPNYIKKAAKESLLMEQLRSERMDAHNSIPKQQGPQSQQHRGNNKKHVHNYKSEVQQQPTSTKASTVNTAATTNTPKPPSRYGNPRQESQQQQKRCIFCNKTDHWGQFCRNVKPKDPNVNQRLYAVIRARKCLNCLGRDYHVATKCEKPSQCGIDGCVEKHHKLLHGADFNRVKSMTQGLQTAAENAKKAQEAAAVAKADKQGNQHRRVTFRRQGRSGSRNRNNRSQSRDRSRSGSRGPKKNGQNQQGKNGVRSAAEDTGATTTTAVDSSIQ